jgi:hypothetical protein
MNGKDGIDGTNGRDGQKGDDGQNGKDGENGRDGATGPRGKDGETGTAGEDGATGPRGKDGATGPPGKVVVDEAVETVPSNPKPNSVNCPQHFESTQDPRVCKNHFGGKCDIGYLWGNPQVSIPSCEIKGYQPDAAKMKTHSRPWNFYPCPHGLTRYGDGSACKSGSNTCDLGYVAGSPNMQRSCEIKGYQPDAAKMKTHSRPWNFYPCPHGLTRYGDGSACKSKHRKCDLGFVSGAPNKDGKSDLVIPAGVTSRYLSLGFNEGNIVSTADHGRNLKKVGSVHFKTDGVVGKCATNFNIGRVGGTNFITYDQGNFKVSHDGKERTYIAWYRGSPNQKKFDSGNQFSCGVTIFGDPTNNVYIGLGLQNGKIAVCNQNHGSRGKTNVVDGKWHLLAWVFSGRGTTTKLYASSADGKMNLEHEMQKTYNCHTGNAFCGLHNIGVGYPYRATTAPTDLDGIQIYNSALTTKQLQEIQAGAHGHDMEQCQLSSLSSIPLPQPKICERKSSIWAIPNKQVCQTVAAARFKVEIGKRYAVSVKGEMAVSSGSRWGGGHCTFFVVDGTKKSSDQPGFKTSCNLFPTPGYTDNWSVAASSKKLPIDINWIGAVKVPELAVYTVHCKHYFELSRPLITTLEELDCSQK